MDQTQNANTPEPKKSFWAKLFGGGKPAAAPTPPNNQPSDSAPAPDSTVSSQDNAIPPASSTSSMNVAEHQASPNFVASSASPVAEPKSAWSESTNQAKFPAEPAPLDSPAPIEPVPPTPSWRDTAPEPAPASDVPVPPSDPMVTPVQTPEEPADEHSELPPVTEQAATPSWSPPQNVSDPEQPKDADQADSDRPSVTPPTR